ncbi:putative cyclin-dependent kinase F-2 [Panicum miliaceum]|uniref:[RNA-polymerase]-subunit kinase n=1 Tax=Panicum miliaceum TaxID=4540 RepID=A0A3L6PUH5_PANMI|nr:putative cyclin-dependent kinase F-2 [Panicum miliaceum]
MAEPAAAAVRNHTATGPAGLKRRRVAVGSTEQYEETACRLGEGAFGTVVKARHRDTGRIVAIKRLGAVHGGPGAALREARFLEEACGGGANPFVVGFHGVVRAPGTLDLCLVMDCVGPSLHDVLRQLPRGALPLPEATPAGTLWYMAPEMLLEKPDYDTQVDIWSLGCVMAELISNGRPLFQGFHGQGQLSAIFEVLGAPDDSTWPWFSSTAFATAVMPQLDVQRENHLRELFPETKLSKEGFEVLSGLLTCNPDKRLTAAAALEHPWFAKIDALALPNKVEVLSRLPKRRRIHHIHAVCVT